MFPQTLPLLSLLVLILASPLWGQASDIPVDCSAAPVIGQDFAICFPTCPPVCLPDPGGISLHTDFALPPAAPSGDSLDSVVLTKGSFVDPWRVSAGIASPQIILDVKGLGNMPDRFGEFFGIRYITGRVLSVTATNRSADVWTGFEIELRSALNTPSDRFDGLSFGKVRIAGTETIDLFKPPSVLNTPCEKSGWDFPCADRFQKFTFNKGLDSIGDVLTFEGGGLPPGHDATFTFLITDNYADLSHGPPPLFRQLFYLMLRPQPAPNAAGK